MSAQRAAVPAGCRSQVSADVLARYRQLTEKSHPNSSSWHTLLNPDQHRWSANFGAIAEDLKKMPPRPDEALALTVLFQKYLYTHVLHDDPYNLPGILSDTQPMMKALNINDISFPEDIRLKLDFWRKILPDHVLRSLSMGTARYGISIDDRWEYSGRKTYRITGKTKEEMYAGMSEAVKEDNMLIINDTEGFKAPNPPITDEQYKELMELKGLLILIDILRLDHVPQSLLGVVQKIGQERRLGHF